MGEKEAQIENFISDLEQVGRWESQGSFTIDSLRADKKLTEFYRTTPGKWIIKFVQAAIAAESEWVSIRLKRTSLELEFATSKSLSSEPLADKNDEYANFLREGVQGLVCGEGSLHSISILTLLQDDKSTVTSLNRGENATVLELDTPDLSGEFEKALSRRREHACHVLIQIRIQSDSWMQGIRDSIRFRANITGSLKGRLDSASIPIIMDGRPLGLGQVLPIRACATECTLAPKHHDSIVREQNPGRNSMFFDIFGSRVRGVERHHRILSRWCQTEHPLFGPCPNPVVSFEPKLDEPIHLSILNPGKHFPEHVIPIHHTNSEGEYSCRSHLTVSPDFSIAPHAAWLRSPNSFSASLFIRLPEKPGTQDSSQLIFYRRGVLLERVSIDLIYPGAICEVACPSLKTDFSGYKLVKDENFEQLQAYLNQRLEVLIAETLSAAWAVGKKLTHMSQWAEELGLKSLNHKRYS